MASTKDDNNCMYSTAQAVIPFTFDGKLFYTHTSWLSERQYRAFHNIPV